MLHSLLHLFCFCLLIQTSLITSKKVINLAVNIFSHVSTRCRMFPIFLDIDFPVSYCNCIEILGRLHWQADISSRGRESRRFDGLLVVQDQLDKDESEVDPKRGATRWWTPLEEKSNCWYGNAFHLTFALFRCGLQGLKCLIFVSFSFSPPF